MLKRLCQLLHLLGRILFPALLHHSRIVVIRGLKKEPGLLPHFMEKIDPGFDDGNQRLKPAVINIHTIGFQHRLKSRDEFVIGHQLHMLVIEP